MKSTAAAYLATLIAFVAIDFVWLSFAAERLYRPALKDILLDGFRPAPAVVFYVVFAAGLVALAVRPGLAAGSFWLAVGNAAAVGLIGYATYDLTNQATLRNWTTTLTLMDLAWGVTLSAVAGAAGFLAARAVAD
jgi:uncharacterized membrane protein